jgi:hypothetical protein
MRVGGKEKKKKKKKKKMKIKEKKNRKLHRRRGRAQEGGYGMGHWLNAVQEEGVLLQL